MKILKSELKKLIKEELFISSSAKEMTNKEILFLESMDARIIMFQRDLLLVEGGREMKQKMIDKFVNWVVTMLDKIISYIVSKASKAYSFVVSALKKILSALNSIPNSYKKAIVGIVIAAAYMLLTAISAEAAEAIGHGGEIMQYDDLIAGIAGFMREAAAAMPKDANFDIDAVFALSEAQEAIQAAVKSGEISNMDQFGDFVRNSPEGIRQVIKASFAEMQKQNHDVNAFGALIELGERIIDKASYFSSGNM